MRAMKRLITVAALACAFVLAAEATAAGSPLTGQFQTVISGQLGLPGGVPSPTSSLMGKHDLNTTI